MKRKISTPTLAASLTGVLLLAGCGGAGGLAAEGDVKDGQSQTDSTGGAKGSLATSWAPSDTDWYLYGAQSMALIEEGSGLDITVQESAGSEENAIRMDECLVDVGMLDVSGAKAALGEHELSTLYPLSIVLWQLIVGKDTGISGLAELETKDWNPGPIGGGSTQTTMDVLKALDIQPKYYEAALSDAVSAYTGRQIAGFSYRGAGVQPTGAVLEAASSRPISLVDITDEQIAEIQQTQPDLIPVTIPGGTYSDVPEDIQTFGYWGVIVGASGCLDEETAYTMTKTFWESIDEVNKQLPQTEGLTPEVALEELVLPLHPGAARYYEEIGLQVPDDMVAAKS